jgi:gas vesicle protein
MAKPSLQKIFTKKLKTIDKKIKTSFALIRQDVNEMQTTVNAMRKYLKKKDAQYTYATKQDNKIRDQFRKDVNDFTQNITQLKLALSAVRDLKTEIITIKDLARIEDRIKTAFKNEIESYKEQIKSLKAELKEQSKRITTIENGCIREKKKSWFRRASNERNEATASSENL